MFFLTLKAPRPRFLAGAMAALCLLTATVQLPPNLTETVPTGAVQTVSRKLRSNGERVELLRSLGWQADETPLSAETLLLPDALPETEFLALQREQGFDLPALAGQRVKRYVYQIKGPSAGNTDRRVALLVFQGRAVGGAVYAPGPEGSLSPLFPTD